MTSLWSLRSAAARLDDLAAGIRQLGLVVAQAGIHLRRLADVLGAELAGVAAAGHLLLRRGAGLRRYGQHGRREQQRGKNGFLHESPLEGSLVGSLGSSWLRGSL